jgi:hypothetical protein
MSKSLLTLPIKKKNAINYIILRVPQRKPVFSEAGFELQAKNDNALTAVHITVSFTKQQEAEAAENYFAGVDDVDIVKFLRHQNSISEPPRGIIPVPEPGLVGQALLELVLGHGTDIFAVLGKFQINLRLVRRRQVVQNVNKNKPAVQK